MDDAVRELQSYVGALQHQIDEWKDACRNAFARIYKEIESLKKDIPRGIITKGADKLIWIQSIENKLEKLQNDIDWIMRYKEGPTS